MTAYPIFSHLKMKNIFVNLLLLLYRMRELLRVRLAECGWRDEMILLCRKVIAESDVNKLTVDDILDKITPQGRGRTFFC